jgi:hypothetical protein
MLQFRMLLSRLVLQYNTTACVVAVQRAVTGSVMSFLLCAKRGATGADCYT